MNETINNSEPLPGLADVRQVLDRHHRFVLTTHVNPDGDGLGSELALAKFLRSRGKEVRIINHSAIPDNYRWLDEENEIIHFMPERDRDYLLDAEVIVILDTNQPDRLRSMAPIVQQSTATKVIIDHHLDPHPFADHYMIDDDATSTGEIVFRLITAIDPAALDARIARALYTAIVTDTGSFRFPRTDPEIHRIAARLLECGVDPTMVFSNVYEKWTPGKMRLLGEVLDSMTTAYDGKLAYVVCTQHMFNQTGTTEVETDNFTNFPMSVDGVLVGILFNELHNGVKISFRSKGTIPINELAKEFGGNGHLNAAGARLFDVQLAAIVPAVIEKAGKYIS
jgi:phosphoesterase RecJ-like protein